MSSSVAVTDGISGRTRRGWISSSSMRASGGGLGYLLQRVALLDAELGHLRPAEAGKVGSDAQLLPQFVGQAANVGTRRHPAAEIDQVGGQRPGW